MIAVLYILFTYTSIIDIDIQIESISKKGFGTYIIVAKIKEEKINLICNWCFDEKLFDRIKKEKYLRAKIKIQGDKIKKYYLIQLKKNKTILFDRINVGKMVF